MNESAKVKSRVDTFLSILCHFSFWLCVAGFVKAVFNWDYIFARLFGR